MEWKGHSDVVLGNTIGCARHLKRYIILTLRTRDDVMSFLGEDHDPFANSLDACDANWCGNDTEQDNGRDLELFKTRPKVVVG